jgi:3-oxoacyl-[acyl-carrier protein] reductase
VRQGDRLDLDLSGRVAIVTGAGRRAGIGAAICRILAAHGADILFTHHQTFDRTQPHGEDSAGPNHLTQELEYAGARVASLDIDLSHPDAHRAVLDKAEERLGTPSILVNNAAHYDNAHPDSYRTLTSGSLDAHYAVNVRAMAMLSVEFARRFGAGSGGRIINITSGQSLTPMPDELAYAATKGAAEAFTASLAAGVAEKGITVNAVDPGATDTGWMSEDLKARLIEESRLGRLGQPQDVARIILFLVSDAGQWVTGQTIHSRGA